MRIAQRSGCRNSEEVSSTAMTDHLMERRKHSLRMVLKWGQRRDWFSRLKVALLGHDLYKRKLSSPFDFCGMASRTAPMT